MYETPRRSINDIFPGMVGKVKCNDTDTGDDTSDGSSPSTVPTLKRTNQKQKGTTVLSDSLKRSIAKELYSSRSSPIKTTPTKSALRKSSNKARSTNNMLDVNGRTSHARVLPSSLKGRRPVSISPKRGDDTTPVSHEVNDETIAIPLTGAADLEASRSSSRHQPPRRTSSLKKPGMPRRKVPTRTKSADQLTGLSVQVRLPNSNKPIVKSRSISFSKSVQVRRVPSAAEMLERDIRDSTKARNALWFQAEEYDNIKRKTGALVRAIQQGKTPGGVTYCTRGLEKFFRMDEVQFQRVAAWDSVLDEQDIQRHHGSYDDDRLSSAYQQWTRDCEAQAAERAREDETAIESYIKRTRAMCRTLSVPTTMPSHR